MKEQFDSFEQEFEINEKITKRIKNSILEEPIKNFILKILDIEFREGRGTSYSQSYRKQIEIAAIELENAD